MVSERKLLTTMQNGERRKREWNRKTREWKRKTVISLLEHVFFATGFATLYETERKLSSCNKRMKLNYLFCLQYNRKQVFIFSSQRKCTFLLAFYVTMFYVTSM